MRGAALVALAVLAACAEKRGDPLRPPAPAAPPASAAPALVAADPAAQPVPGGPRPRPEQGGVAAEEAGPLPSPAADPALAPAARIATTDADARFAAAEQAPHVYMSLQPDPSGPVSVVFAIDAARDGTPWDDPAIRLTPEAGKCNPQELARYDFPEDDARRPVFGPEQALDGLTARELPRLLAVEVTAAMLRAGLIQEPEQSRPQNVCTRKLWEQMVLNSSLTRG